MDIDGFIKTVEIMRTAQEDYLKYRWPTLQRRAKTLENAVDREIKEYYKEKAGIAQGHFFTNDH